MSDRDYFIRQIRSAYKQQLWGVLARLLIIDVVDAFTKMRKTLFWLYILTAIFSLVAVVIFTMPRPVFPVILPSEVPIAFVSLTIVLGGIIFPAIYLGWCATGKILPRIIRIIASTLDKLDDAYFIWRRNVLEYKERVDPQHPLFFSFLVYY